jgi:LPXTG-motif cell wall-anchored protein
VPSETSTVARSSADRLAQSGSTSPLAPAMASGLALLIGAGLLMRRRIARP